ncbi:MAG TPA: cytochrome c [Usitatibacteraceae bacterium]|nr:cytochrome c [Usitatibacteraceae bacterium]
MFSSRSRLILVSGLAALGVTLASAQNAPPPGECPQPRFTGKAPDEYLNRKNPIAPGSQPNPQIERIFRGIDGAVGCATCHGRKGDGKGKLADQFTPRPRNFACSQTINGVPDGQLFWIIRFGSPDTAMPPNPSLSDTEVWQMVNYLRTLAK